ncbi:MAG: hypothetical protein DHS20C11_37180 [Lysobacteraceae bacterium]|nr:MAG: hypothetical protein DHS20C11_37180 [Xanthomonadaceae bacterium]
MANDKSKSSSDEETVGNDLAALEKRVDQLLDLCKQLNEENGSLKATQEQLVAERATLVSKSEQARSRVEAMIARLKALETGG